MSLRFVKWQVELRIGAHKAYGVSRGSVRSGDGKKAYFLNIYAPGGKGWWIGKEWAARRSRASSSLTEGGESAAARAKGSEEA